MAKNTKQQKISVLLTKLGDRDTFTMAARELDLMARQIDPTSGNLQSFISVILSADTGDKPAVRKHCIHLLAVLSVSLPPNSLSPFLSKILARITRRLRDPDSSIRSTCVAAVSAISSRTTKPPFSSAFMKPLADTLFTEQEINAQIGAALCLAAAIDAAEDPDPVRLGQTLLPRLEKLVKCNSFKAKSAGVVVIGSVIGAGGVSGATLSSGGLKGLVDCLLSFLVSEDWAARKAAAEALGRLATTERNELGEFKSKSLKIFESRKYDKVKAVREVMNQMMEAWKQVPDLSEEVSPPRSNASSRGGIGGDDGSDGRYPSRSRVGSTSAKSRNRLVNRSTPPGSSIATTARNRTNIKSSDQKKVTSVPSRIKSNVRSRLDWKAGGASIPMGAPLEEERHAHHENIKETSHSNHDKMHKLGGVASTLAGNVPPSSGATMATGHHVMSENQNSRYCKGLEDMSLIRNQLVQIEQQQSNLMDLLQRFIGSSQDGMRGLETRVHGLELALDEVSYDLAVSIGRMNNCSSRNNCCLLPPGNFIRSKFWKKPDSKYSASRLSTYRNRNAQTVGIQDSRQRFNDTAGFIVNPLAEIRPDNGSAVMTHN